MNDIRNDYRDLAELSKDDADLYASRIVADRLAARGSSSGTMMDLIRMQLVQEEYEALFGELMEGMTGAALDEGNPSLQGRLHEAFRRLVSDRVEARPEADQRGLLCEAIRRGRAWLDEDMKPYDMLRLTALPTQDLIDECAHIAQRMTAEMAGGLSFDDGEPEVRFDGGADAALRPSIAASALARYLDQPVGGDEIMSLTAAAVAGKYIGARCAAGEEDGAPLANGEDGGGHGPSGVVFIMVAAAAVVFCGGFVIDALIGLSACAAAGASVDASGIRQRLSRMMRAVAEDVHLMTGFVVTGLASRLPEVLQRMYDGLALRGKDRERQPERQLLRGGDLEVVIAEGEAEEDGESEHEPDPLGLE